MLAKMVGLQVTAPACYMWGGPDRPCPQPLSIIDPYLVVRLRCGSQCNRARSGEEDGGRRGKSLFKGDSLIHHAQNQSSCALTSLPPLPVTYSPFSFGFTSPILNLNVRRNILSLTLYLSLWLSSFLVLSLYSGPHPLQEETIHVIAVYFREENDVGETSFPIPYLALI